MSKVNWNNSGYEAGSKQAEFVAKLGPAIESAIEKQGLSIPPEGVVAQLAFESGWGKSSLATQSYNFGGLTAGSTWSGATVAKADKQGEKAGNVTINQDFRVYDSVQDFADDYVKFVQKPRYSVALDQKDPYHYALELGKAGYHNNNDAEYASDVAGVARKVNPAANEKYEALAKEYKDIGDKARAGKINDAADKWIAGAGDERVRTARKQEHEGAIAQISQKNPELGQALTAFLALILFALGDHEAAEALLDSAFSDPDSRVSNRNDATNEAYSSAGTGGQRYNRRTEEYDGDKTPATTKTLGSYSSMVDPSQFESGESTLKSSRGTATSKIRDDIKAEYTSRLDPYLYKGDPSEIPDGVPVMVLDLGHLGKGNDLGAGKWVNGQYLCEAGACMETNLAVAKSLSEQGVIIVSTSQSPKFESNTLTPGSRQKFAQSIVDEVGKDRMFFMSTHFNAAGSSVKGAAMYTEMSNPRSMAFAQEMQGAIVQAGHFKQFGKGVIDDKDSQHKALSVTSKSYASVLPELGFRDGDALALSSKEKMRAVGETLAEAIKTVGEEKFNWKLQEKEQLAEKPTKEVIEKAAKLTAGLELKEQKVEGWPPGVSADVLDAALAKAQQNALT